MKKWMVIAVLIALLLTGCRSVGTLETVTDTWDTPQMPEPQELMLELPKNAAMATLTSEKAGTLYFCNGYTVAVQTMPAGNLDGTLREITGYGRENLKIMETGSGECTRYDFVWSCAGENGDQVCRGAVLSDGNYHYTMTAMIDEENAGALSETMQALFSSFVLAKDSTEGAS